MRRETEDARRRIKSEMSTALHYPSYLEGGPDYEAEMRYFSGDTLSPRDKVTILKCSGSCVRTRLTLNTSYDYVCLVVLYL